MSECTYIPELVSAVGTVLAAGLAAVGSIWFFYRQKDYELVKQRYLTEGVDVVISEAEHALNTFHHNWARALEILKSFRDIPDFDSKQLRQGFLELSERCFSLTANYRVNSIVDSPLIWQVYQLVMSFAQYASSVAKDEIPAGLEVKLTTESVKAPRKEMVDEAVRVLTELDEKSREFHVFIGQMQRLSALVETQRFSTKGIRKLSKHSEVQDVLKILKERYGDRISGNNPKT